MGNDTATMNCRRARHRLAILAGDRDGADLGWDERRRVERHLIACPGCRAEHAAIESAVGVLHAVAAVPPVHPDAPSLWPDLARQIRGSRHPRRHPWIFRWTSAPAWGMAAGLLFVGTAIGLTGGWHLGRQDARRNPGGSPAVAQAPRPALPTGPAQLVNNPQASKADAGLPNDPKALNPRDPMRSQ